MIEIMIVLAIVTTLFAIAIPAFSQMMADQRIRSVTSDLAGDLALARAEAVKRSSRVGLSRTGDEWQEGWVIFDDVDRDGVRDEDEPILGEHVAVPNAIKICSMADAVDVVTFGGDGRVRAFEEGALVNSFSAIKVSSIKASSARKASEVVLGPSGRASVNAIPGIAECP